MRTRTYGGVTGKAGDSLPMSIVPFIVPNGLIDQFCIGGWSGFL